MIWCNFGVKSSIVLLHNQQFIWAIINSVHSAIHVLSQYKYLLISVYCPNCNICRNATNYINSFYSLGLDRIITLISVCMNKKLLQNRVVNKFWFFLPQNCTRNSVNGRTRNHKMPQVKLEKLYSYSPRSYSYPLANDLNSVACGFKHFMGLKVRWNFFHS